LFSVWVLFACSHRVDVLIVFTVKLMV